MEVPVDTVFFRSVTRDREMLAALFAAIDHVRPLRLKGHERRLEVLRGRFQSQAYWRPARSGERADDAQWLLDRINECTPRGVYFGDCGPKPGWGFWRD